MTKQDQKLLIAALRMVRVTADHLELTKEHIMLALDKLWDE